MAAIGNIRKHYGLLVVIVGIALLAFVLGDLFRSTNSRRTTNVATVGSEKVTYQDYTNLVNMNLENVKAQNGGSLSASDNYAVHANTLEQMIRDIIMKNEYKDLGLVVSDDELFDQFLGENPNQYVVQSFTNPDGSFNKALIETYIREFQTLSPEMKANWLNFENAIREDRLNTKYETLLKKGFYLPNKLAARIYADKNDKTSAEVYAVRYSTVADSAVVVNEADNKHSTKQTKTNIKQKQLVASTISFSKLLHHKLTLNIQRTSLTNLKTTSLKLKTQLTSSTLTQTFHTTAHGNQEKTFLLN